MKTLSNDTMRQARGGGTIPNDNSGFVALVAATWPGPKGAGGIFAPPPGSIALAAELSGLSVKDVVALFQSF